MAETMEFDVWCDECGTELKVVLIDHHFAVTGKTHLMRFRVEPCPGCGVRVNELESEAVCAAKDLIAQFGTVKFNDRLTTSQVIAVDCLRAALRVGVGAREVQARLEEMEGGG